MGEEDETLLYGGSGRNSVWGPNLSSQTYPGSDTYSYLPPLEDEGPKIVGRVQGGLCSLCQKEVEVEKSRQVSKKGVLRTPPLSTFLTTDSKPQSSFSSNSQTVETRSPKKDKVENVLALLAKMNHRYNTPHFT